MYMLKYHLAKCSGNKGNYLQIAIEFYADIEYSVSLSM